ncbi:Wadjet anti-phage system protein JetD domain-containing protein [Pseudonocardia cypriaca]|uniref:Uncharacterized protein DUF2220 n=1 Tax=Pseudonocardia cypriaca TaxID=882449 RepID=A0A543GCT8_9PSEU|nr:Wadjet anti-phage system protein JetD domain-containing protein [Pseudonocardia cypriaca]TQM43905.1 uncharacterized protein DUF2220 [Pseudonocardia cypriaca]
MYENYLPLLGGMAGRTPLALNGIPDGLGAVTVPVRRQGEDRVPRDTKRRTRISQADLHTTARTSLFAPPDGMSTTDLAWVLDRPRRKWSTVVSRFGHRAEVVTDKLIRAGGIVLRCDVDEDRMKLGQPREWRLSNAWQEQAPDALAELRPRRDPDVVRSEMIALLAGLTQPRLSIEREALEGVPPGTGFVVPDRTATTAKSWATYEAALRAACTWTRMDRVPGAAELAGHAWGDTHIEWSGARILVFSQLVGEDFPLAVDRSDVEIRLRGPLVWQHGCAIADASRARPWIGLPKDGMRLLGEIKCSATGVLVMENAETFQVVSAMPDITESWLCVWGKGKAVVNTADLINSLGVGRVAAWMDLDATGLEIFTMLGKTIHQPVLPVAMTLDLLMTGPARQRANPELQAKAERADKLLAAKIEPRLSGELVEMARYIKETGKAVEQQLLHERVLPHLLDLLESL